MFCWQVILMLLLAVRLRWILCDISHSFVLRLAITVFTIVLVYTVAQVNVVSTSGHAITSLDIWVEVPKNNCNCKNNCFNNFYWLNSSLLESTLQVTKCTISHCWKHFLEFMNYEHYPRPMTIFLRHLLFSKILSFEFFFYTWQLLLLGQLQGSREMKDNGLPVCGQ